MDRRYFNGVAMPPLNHAWSAKVLNMEMMPYPCKGIDLFDDKKGVELKFKVLYPEKYVHKGWRVLEEGLSYSENGKPVYWGLGFYTLSQLASKIKATDIRLLELLVESRELYLVQWDWMNQFPPYLQEGMGKTGPYRNTIRFPKFAMLPKVIDSIHVQKGFVHFTEGVPTNAFKISKKEIPGAIPLNCLQAL